MDWDKYWGPSNKSSNISGDDALDLDIFIQEYHIYINGMGLEHFFQKLMDLNAIPFDLVHRWLVIVLLNYLGTKLVILIFMRCDCNIPFIQNVDSNWDVWLQKPYEARCRPPSLPVDRLDAKLWPAVGLQLIQWIWVCGFGCLRRLLVQNKLVHLLKRRVGDNQIWRFYYTCTYQFISKMLATRNSRM